MQQATSFLNENDQSKMNQMPSAKHKDFGSAYLLDFQNHLPSSAQLAGFNISVLPPTHPPTNHPE